MASGDASRVHPQNLNHLLQWGIANSDVQAAPVDPVKSREHLQILNQIMASQVSDAKRMQAAVAILNDEASELEDKLTAWDELEMLVESLDNANDIEPLKLWPDIVKNLTNSESELVVQCLWVCGTAIQNNPKPQKEFLETGSLPTVIDLVSDASATAEVRSKALYCLGGAIKHSEEGYRLFLAHNGWASLDSALKDPSIACRRKAAFLIASIFQNTEQPTETLEQARSSPVIATLVSSLTPNMAPFGENGDQAYDADLMEKAAGALYTILKRAGGQALTAAEKADVSKALKEADSTMGLAQSELADFAALVQ